MIALAAVTAAAVFSGFSVVTVDRYGTMSSTEAIIDRAKIATRAYVREHHDLLMTDIRAIARLFADLSERDLQSDREVLNQRLAGYAFWYRLAGVFVTDAKGNVLGGSDRKTTRIPVTPDVSRLEQGNPIVYTGDRQLAAAMKLPGFDEAFLFVTRDLNPALLGMFGETARFIRDFDRSRNRLRQSRILFAAISACMALFVFTIAFILGMRAAKRDNDRRS